MTRENDRPGRIQFAEEEVQGARIKVVGVGGGGGNAISRMMASGLQGIEFIAVNTDLQALRANRAPVKIQVGAKLTKGLGAGANPDVGRQAAIEDTEKICDALEGSDMIFITAGLGGGTGTGAAPVVASIASQLGGETGGVLSIAVVTLPFALEGKRRMAQALDGLGQLRECVDSVIAIPNDRLLNSVARNTPVTEAFRVADDVLRPTAEATDATDTDEAAIDLPVGAQGTATVEGVRRLALTERELQVLRGMADGKSNAEIGRELFVSEDTVKTHARRLFRKLSARDRAHAVAAAFRAGLVH